ncbi:MAG TPA: hypothetical protein VKD45_00590, partial [Hyphomicrobiaceae bacterium]|nr:hypothetical protein [Hyphomicrobiaceae bacterium]
MNYRFGFSLGKTALDGQIYGAASAAADCFKALVPFFLFAAIRNRMWSQALAAGVVWAVVTGYSMTSALGHAARNRLDTTGQRAVEAANYKDLRADSKRAQEQLTWIPAHRPAETVTAELNVLKAQRYWLLTRECAEVSGKSAREFCQQFYKLNAEFASAQESQKLESRIADIAAKLANTAAGTVMAEADPQASVLSKLTGLAVDKVQTALTIFVALLIEIGSGFGMYVAFAYWRINDRAATKQAAAPLEVDAAPSPAALLSTETVASEIEVAPLPSTAGGTEEQVVGEAPMGRRLGANDNRVARGVPDSDVQRFYRERVVAAAEGSSLTSTELYEEYCRWCEDNDKEPFAHPRVTREIGELGVKKERIGKRTRYFGIALRSEAPREEDGTDRKVPASLSRAA